MNQIDIMELKKRMKKKEFTVDTIAGCYVDNTGGIHGAFKKKVLDFDEEEIAKYLNILKKTLSGIAGNQQLTLSFTKENEEKVNGIHALLMKLRNGTFEDAILEALYERIADTYQTEEPYAIFVFHDIYDVPRKASDGVTLEDEISETYEYAIIAITPIKLSKSALIFSQNEESITMGIREWQAKPPVAAFLFPAFEERSSDIHEILFYTKNVKQVPEELCTDFLEVKPIKTHEQKRMIVNRIFQEILGTEESECILLDFRKELDNRVKARSVNTMNLNKALAEESLDELGLGINETQEIKNRIVDQLKKEVFPLAVLINEKELQKHELYFEKKELQKKVKELEKR